MITKTIAVCQMATVLFAMHLELVETSPMISGKPITTTLNLIENN